MGTKVLLGTKLRRGGGRLALLGALAAAALLAAIPSMSVGAALAQQDGVEVVEDEQPAPLPVATAPRKDPAELIREVVALVNVERAKEGAPALQVNDQLMRAAQDYSGILGQGACFEHTCAPVPELRNRLANAGYANVNRIGENIAAGDETAADVVAGWMGSPGHRKNIMNPGFREIGVGVTRSQGEFGIYWVQVFGTRAQ